MNALGFSLTLPAVALFLVLSSTAGSLGCSNTSSHGDGVGGARAGSGGSNGGGGATGAGGGVGGRGGTTDAGADVRGDVRGDVRADVSGAGGMIVIVDGSGNNFTCAQLLACCNSTTNQQAKALCLMEYNNVSPGGDSACNGILSSIKANGLCP